MCVTTANFEGIFQPNLQPGFAGVVDVLNTFITNIINLHTNKFDDVTQAQIFLNIIRAEPHRITSLILHRPYLLTPWSRVPLEKLPGLQLVKKFPAFYGTRRFITALTSALHLSIS
jgi:hypothetical protein